MEVQVFSDVKQAFRNTEEYIKILMDYKRAISQLKTNENVYKIFRFENLFVNKNMVEAMYSLQKGFARDITSDEVEIFEKGVDETIDFNALLDSEPYATLLDEINKAKKDMLADFKEQIEVIDELFEIYSSINYELIKAAYAIGHEIKKNGTVFQGLMNMDANT